jgi:hypothetical protein
MACATRNKESIARTYASGNPVNSPDGVSIHANDGFVTLTVKMSKVRNGELHTGWNRHLVGVKDASSLMMSHEKAYGHAADMNDASDSFDLPFLIAFSAKRRRDFNFYRC